MSKVIEVVVDFPDKAVYSYRVKSNFFDQQIGEYGPGSDEYDNVCQDIFEVGDHAIAGIANLHGSPTKVTIREVDA